MSILKPEEEEKLINYDSRFLSPKRSIIIVDGDRDLSHGTSFVLKGSFAGRLGSSVG